MSNIDKKNFDQKLQKNFLKRLHIFFYKKMTALKRLLNNFWQHITIKTAKSKNWSSFSPFKKRKTF